MKTAIKRVLVTTLSAASIFSVTSSAFADELSQPTTPTPIEVFGNGTNGDADGPIITPMATTKPFNMNFAGDRTSDIGVFVTSADIPWAKVTAYNTGTGNMVVTIFKDSPSGQVMSQFILSPGQQNYTVGMMPDPGTYYVSFSSGTGYLKGSASCRIASTYAEVMSGS